MRHPNPSHRLVPFVVVLVAAAVGSCTSARPAAERPLPVIDALVHTNFDGKEFAESRVVFSKEELAAEMRRNDVVGAVSVNRPGDPIADLSGSNVVACGNVGATEDAAALESGLASRRYRCLTIYLGVGDRYAYDRAYEPMYQLAERYRVPVVFYIVGSSLTYGDPHTVDRVARSHPRVTFVLAHAADPRTIAERDRDEFLNKKVPYHFYSFAHQTQVAAEVAAANPNVVLDGSGLLIGDLRSEERDAITEYLVKPVKSAFAKVGPAKLLFGSGWPVTDIGPYLEAFKRAIPRSDWQAVLHDNAARVYGFGEASPAN
ncbi:MAG TPA: amidohydrolase family protein [Thermoanaerobaculaceae bacterium]|nr:amidohydrolase family protein [Thermoanaerobaculaceae bacterium]